MSWNIGDKITSAKLNALETATTVSIPSSYTIYKDTETTYYAKSHLIGGLNYGGSGDANGVNGTNASAVIQAAIDALTTGGKIFIKQGSYTINQTIQLKNDLAIIGEGTATRLVNSASNTNNSVLLAQGTGWDDMKQRIILSDLWIQGNKPVTGDNAHCIQMIYSRDAFLNNLYFWRAGARYVGGDGGSGLETDHCNDIYATNIIADSMAGKGFDIRTTDTMALTNCLAAINDLSGFFFDDCIRLLIQGCASKSSGAHGFELQNSTYCKINGNMAWDVAEGLPGSKHIIEAGTSDYNLITDNVIFLGGETGSIPLITVVGANTVVKDNHGYNPVGVITNPYPTTTGNLTNSSATQAYPTSNAVYTVVNTPKTVIVGGGTISAIAINGLTTGLTSGVFHLDIAETIKVTWSDQPTINQVRAE